MNWQLQAKQPLHSSLEQALPCVLADLLSGHC
jgi:hypothetical protein